mmetsp:Transcript_34939/g.114070  ORF Transcript_34939/g.114070 Transcript_34939/m.114070 type:complete len:224 (+) Transcript_34939:411-1082(+)
MNRETEVYIKPSRRRRRFPVQTRAVPRTRKPPGRAPSCRRSARGHPSRWRRGWRCPCARGSVAAFGSASRRSSAPCSGARRAGRSSRSRHAAACGRCQRSRRQIARVAVRGSHGKRRCGSAHTLLASARKGRRQRRSPRRRGGRRGHPLMEPGGAAGPARLPRREQAPPSSHERTAVAAHTPSVPFACLCFFAPHPRRVGRLLRSACRRPPSHPGGGALGRLA